MTSTETFPNFTIVAMPDNKLYIRFERAIGDVEYIGPFKTKREAERAARVRDRPVESSMPRQT